MKPSQFAVGDWVLYFNPRRVQGGQDKRMRKFTGSHLVVKVLGPVNYLLQRSKRSQPFTVHVDKLKPFDGDTPTPWISAEAGDDAQEGGHVRDADLPNVDRDVVDEGDTVNNGPSEDTAVEPDVPDVIAFSEDQEFRRNRPRRNIVLPARFRTMYRRF